jgi:hypothetical protein
MVEMLEGIYGLKLATLEQVMPRNIRNNQRILYLISHIG